MVKLDFDKVMIVFEMGCEKWYRNRKSLDHSTRITLHHMYMQLNDDEKEPMKNEYPEFIAYLITTN